MHVADHPRRRKSHGPARGQGGRHSLVVAAHRRQRQRPPEVSRAVVRIEGQAAVAGGDGSIVTPGEVLHDAVRSDAERRGGLDRQESIAFGDGLVDCGRCRREVGEDHVELCRRIERDRPPIALFGRGPVPIGLGLHVGERLPSGGQGRVEGDGPPRRHPGRGQHLERRLHAERGEQHQDVAEGRVTGSVVGIERHGPFEMLPGRLQIGLGARDAEQGQAAVESRPRVGNHRVLQGRRRRVSGPRAQGQHGHEHRQQRRAGHRAKSPRPPRPWRGRRWHGGNRAARRRRRGGSRPSRCSCGDLAVEQVAASAHGANGEVTVAERAADLDQTLHQGVVGDGHVSPHRSIRRCLLTTWPAWRTSMVSTSKVFGRRRTSSGPIRTT